MADRSLIPALRYALERHPIDGYKHVGAYSARALERPSVQGLSDDVASHLATVV